MRVLVSFQLVPSDCLVITQITGIPVSVLESFCTEYRATTFSVQYNLIITLSLGSTKTDHVISETVL